ncbi:hypothetical protein [Microcoleus sp. FACHB-672]|uniref:hypothetical protein n=1 Tax=Microcoleus sp. FACHB-672 TaxID=2692825 RepID=UPI001688D6FB|nr:hypothetical protein [Microcoleus sp. FACHB-672]MBD2039474.1 hypothetical protein [Microcoleus sp. FACHB-672]
MPVGIVKAQQVKGFWVADRIYRRDGTYVAVFNKHHCVLVTRLPDIKRKEWRQQGYHPVAVRDVNRHLVLEPELWFWQKFVTDAEVPTKA